MSVPESIAWLEQRRDAKSPSMSKAYATTILDELQRLSEALAAAVRDSQERERLREEALASYRSVESTLRELEKSTQLGREEWDAKRTELDRRVELLTEKLEKAETVLKDAHHALIHQPELTRENIAWAITSIVTPYAEGERP